MFERLAIGLGIALAILAALVFVARDNAHSQSACPTGQSVVSINGATTCGGVPPQCWNAGGTLGACKVWIGTATIASGGTWSVSFAATGFTSIPIIQVSPNITSNSGFVQVTSATCTTTGCSGTATGAANLLGILTLGLTNITGSTLSVQVIGS